MESITATINGWKKFNPRGDVKRPSWFRLEHDLFENTDFFGFQPAEIAAWLYLLCQASRKNCEQVDIHFGHAERVARIKPSILKSALKKLEANGSVTLTSRVRNADVTDTNATYERTNVRDVHNEQENYDFESVYKKYPRKEGKQIGLAKARRDVETPEEFARLGKAIDRFIEHHKQQKTEAKFIPHFSTFMTSWKDWLEPEVGSVVGFNEPKKFSIAELIATEDENATA